MAQSSGENDETSTTHHQSSLVSEEAHETEAQAEPEPSSDISLRIHRRVAKIAAEAYRRASAQSNVLNKSRLQDIALVNIDELEVGKFLGKGSFSNVHEITKISARPRAYENGHANGSGDSFDDPRKYLASNYCRSQSGTYRYAIKFLRDDVMQKPDKYAIGTADLVVEGMFLASIAHPNIIKVRGLPQGGVQALAEGNARGYFLILDRLFDTLGDRIYTNWVEEHQLVKGCFGLKSKPRRDQLAERLRVSLDISAALNFLHNKRIIYRDLKPENLGFDVRGDIKLFDLGLVKELHPNDKDRNGNYKLSMAGTPRYMAPECGMYQPYNLSADVYSLSMLLWEILALEKPLKDFTYSRLKNEVFEDAYRPPIKKVWLASMRVLISSGWHDNPRKRPTMQSMYEQLKAAYKAMVRGEVSEDRVSHNRRRSTFIPSRVTTTSVRHLVSLRASDVTN